MVKITWYLLHYFLSIQISVSFAFTYTSTSTNLHEYNPSIPTSRPLTSSLLRASPDGKNEESDLKFQQRSKSWIVLVDDEESIRLAVGNFLYDAGYAVTACADAEALLELLTSASSGNIVNMPTKLPSVIICDIRMPGGGMGGLELLDVLKNPSSKRVVSESSDLEFVRSQWRRIPVVMLTAKSLTQDRIEGYRKGADVYLPKPFAPEELLSIVDNLIRRMVALSGADSGKNLRDVKADIIDIKAMLKSAENENGGNRRKYRDREEAGTGATAGNRNDGRQLRMLKGDGKGNNPNSSAIVPRKKAGKQSMFQKEIDELSSKAELTTVEEDVLVLLSEGNTNGEIAEEMSLSLVRISRIISNLYSKTFTKTRTELVRWAIKMGYVSAK